jgi:hypothetical protein
MPRIFVVNAGGFAEPGGGVIGKKDGKVDSGGYFKNKEEGGGLTEAIICSLFGTIPSSAQNLNNNEEAKGWLRGFINANFEAARKAFKKTTDNELYNLTGKERVGEVGNFFFAYDGPKIPSADGKEKLDVTILTVAAPNFTTQDYTQSTAFKAGQVKYQNSYNDDIAKSIKQSYENIFRHFVNNADRGDKLYLYDIGTSIFSPNDKFDYKYKEQQYKEKGGYTQFVQEIEKEVFLEYRAQIKEKGLIICSECLSKLDGKSKGGAKIEGSKKIDQNSLTTAAIGTQKKSAEEAAQQKREEEELNIIGLKEEGRENKKYAGEKNYYTKETITANKDDTVFVFGANAGHTKHRIGNSGDGGQAAEVFKAKATNVLPIITRQDSLSEEQLNFYKTKTEGIIKEFVADGGKVVFPLTTDGKKVNVGTRLAQNPEMQGWATNLYNELQKVKVKKHDPTGAMQRYNDAMDKLQNKMRAMVVGSEQEETEEEAKKKILQDKDIGDVKSFMKWNEDAYEKLKQDPANKSDLELFLNPKDSKGKEVFAGWGGRLSHEDNNIFNINHVIDGGFAAAIGLKKGDKIEIDLNHNDFRGTDRIQFTGKILEAALINKLRAGNLDGINKIGVYDLNNGANRRILEEYYKNDIRMFEDNQLRTDQEEVESKLDPVSQALVEKRRQDMTGEARADGRRPEDIEAIKSNGWMIDPDLKIFSKALGVRFSISLIMQHTQQTIYLPFGDDEELPEIKLRMTAPDAGAIAADRGFHYEYIKRDGILQQIPGDGSCGFHAILAGLYDLDNNKKSQIQKIQISNEKLNLDLSLNDVDIDNIAHMKNVQLLRKLLYTEITKEIQQKIREAEEILANDDSTEDQKAKAMDFISLITDEKETRPEQPNSSTAPTSAAPAIGDNGPRRVFIL